MPRTSSTNKPLVALSPYRITPLRNWTSPIAVVMRGRRFLRKLGDRKHVAAQLQPVSGQGSFSPPMQLLQTPSPPRAPNNGGLQRTYSFLEPSFRREPTSYPNAETAVGMAGTEATATQFDGENPSLSNGEPKRTLISQYHLPNFTLLYH